MFVIYIIENVRLYEKWQVEKIDYLLSNFVINVWLKKGSVFSKSFDVKWSIHNCFFLLIGIQTGGKLQAGRFCALNASMYECNKSLKCQSKMFLNYVKTGERKYENVFSKNDEYIK